jgi:hypothetical protein
MRTLRIGGGEVGDRPFIGLLVYNQTICVGRRVARAYNHFRVEFEDEFWPSSFG